MAVLDIINALAASRRAVQLYPPEHPTHREAVDLLIKAVHDTVDVRPLVLNVLNARLHEGSEVIAESTPTVRALALTLEARRVESLTFHVGFGRVDATGLSEALSLRPTPELQVQAELEERGVHAVTVSELEDRSSAVTEERDRQREADRALYRQTLAGLKEIISGLADDTPVDAMKVRRTLGALIHRTAEAPYSMLALASMTGHGERLRFHSVSVMLHSIVLGARLGLSDRQLLSLGLAGLMHDTGLFLLPEGRTGLYQTHSLAGAQALGAVPDEECDAMVVALEHHMGADGTGFPNRPPDYPVHPYSRIVAIADRYDNLLRPAEGVAMTPDEAVASMLREASGGPLDPVLTRLFAQVVGVLPVACIVRLSDFSVGIVKEPGEDPVRPHVRLVTGKDGGALNPAVDVVLAEDPRSVVEVMPEGLLGIRPSDHL